MIQYFAVIFTISLNSLGRIIHRSVLKKEKRTILYAFLFNLLAGLFLLPTFFLFFELPNDPMAWLICLVSSIFWWLSGITGFKAYSLLEVSILNTIMDLRIFFVLLFSLLFLGERVTLLKILGSILIFLGIRIITTRKIIGKISKSGILLAVLTSLFISFSVLLDKIAVSKYFSPFMYSPLQYLLPAFYFVPMIRREKIGEFFSRYSKYFIATSLISAWRFFFQLLAYQYIDLSTVYPLFRLSTVITVIFGIVFLKEREHIFGKMFGAFLSFFGSYLIMISD